MNAEHSTEFARAIVAEQQRREAEVAAKANRLAASHYEATRQAARLAEALAYDHRLRANVRLAAQFESLHNDAARASVADSEHALQLPEMHPSIQFNDHVRLQPQPVQEPSDADVRRMLIDQYRNAGHTVKADQIECGDILIRIDRSTCMLNGQSVITIDCHEIDVSCEPDSNLH